MIKKQFTCIVLIVSTLIVGFGCSKNNEQIEESSNVSAKKENYLALFNPQETSQVVTISAGDWGIWELVVLPSEKTTTRVYQHVGDYAPSFVLQFEFNDFKKIKLSWGRGSVGFSDTLGSGNIFTSSAGYTGGALGGEYVEPFLSEWRKDHEVLSLRQFFEDYGTPIQKEPSEN